jgi:4-amino-4-deoxy-L-arabinose transferase-like glycosyltransferase
MSSDTQVTGPSDGPSPASAPGPGIRPPRNAVWLSRSAFAGIVVLGAAARFWALDFGLPYTQARPDETFIIDVALALLSGDFWPPFYDYPRLYPYAVTILYLGYYLWGASTDRFTTLADLVASWPIDWPPFFLLSRGLSATAGTLTILVVYAWARRLAGRGVGLLAGLFASLAFLHVRDSHFGTTDVAMTLWAVVTIWLLQRDERGVLTRWTLLAAASAGLATATKYTAALLVVPIAVAVLLRTPRARPRRVLATVASSGTVLAAVFTMALAIGVPFVLFDHARFSVAMSELAGSMSVGVTPDLDLPNGWWYHLSRSLRYGLGLPLLALGMAGAAVMVRRDWRAATVFWSYPAACFAVAGAINNLYTRYMVSVVPFLCIAAAMAAAAVARAVHVRFGRAAAAVVIAAATCAVVPSASSVIGFNRVLAQVDNRVLAANWVERNVPRGSTLVLSGSQYGQIQLPRGHGLRVWRWDRRQQRFTENGRPVTERPDWIVLQESPLPGSRNQPVVLEWLDEGYRQAAEFVAFAPATSVRVYDAQDMFYVPLSGFAGVGRPGPNLRIFMRAGAANDEPRPQEP